VSVGWRKPRNEELYNLYASSNIITVIDWRIMRWEVHIARMRVMKYVQNLGRKNLKGRENLEDLGVDGTVLECIFRKSLGG
jgi:hypothetical protein